MGSEGRAECLNQFSHVMESTGPYEDAPVLAVAVSGGGDSMALALLADKWARHRGGKIIALTVDHGLRTGSDKEASQVGNWLQRYNIEHHTLTWVGPKPTSAIQARARAARYDLMENWCRENSILHLLLGHTTGDQAETFLMRLEKGSGPDGLSAMSIISERRDCRLIRPLLSLSGTNLRTYLRAENQVWIEDPSNQNEKFDRIRWRNLMADQGLAPDGYCQAADRYAMARTVLEAETARLAASALFVHPAGFIRLSRKLFLNAQQDLAERLLARVLSNVGGTAYPPRRRKVADLFSLMAKGGFQSRTLGRCRIVESDDDLLVSRERRWLPKPIKIEAETRMLWDGRFDLSFHKPSRRCGEPRFLGPLEESGWRDVVADHPEVRGMAVPSKVLVTLPALFDKDGVFSVPHLKYMRADGGIEAQSGGVNFGAATFRPQNSLSGARYFVAY